MEENRDVSQFTEFLRLLLAPVFVYLFLISINLMGLGFKLLGHGFAERLLYTTSNPFAGLIIGILVTSIIQSSSTTTSITVGLVAAESLALRNAIPIIMGANIGTTVTNTLVSLAHITRKDEFRRAIAAATVHDFFNIYAVLILFPLELTTHIIERISLTLTHNFTAVGGTKLFNPLKLVISPAVDLVRHYLHHPIPILILAFILLFLSLSFIVRIMRRLVVSRTEIFLDKYLFKNDFSSFIVGILLTATVQSSSVTTSIVVPLVGAGLLTVKKIFPYTLGANIGTTVTAIIAALSTTNEVAVTVALAHLVLNILGIIIFYPLRIIPISTAQWFSRVMVKSRKHTVVFLCVYIILHILPLAYLIFLNL